MLGGESSHRAGDIDISSRQDLLSLKSNHNLLAINSSIQREFSPNSVRSLIWVIPRIQVVPVIAWCGRFSRLAFSSAVISQILLLCLRAWLFPPAV